MSAIAPPLPERVGYGVVIGVGRAFATALTHPEINSIGGLYDLVIGAQSQHVVDGNYEGSLLTMTSQQGIFFTIILLVSNFGTVIMDTGNFVKAFAASPLSVVPGYVVGGIGYLSVPWALGTVMSMAALGLEHTKAFPTYPRMMTDSEVTNGLVLPYAAMAVAGKGGAVTTLLMTFMAVISTLSAQVIAVSSIVAFGVIEHTGTKMQLINYAGVVTCPGIFPLILTILWKGQSQYAVIISAYLGLITGLAVCLGTAYKFYGEVTVISTGETLPFMYGTIASALSPLLCTVVITAIKPENFDWFELKAKGLTIKPEYDHDVSVRTTKVVAEEPEAQRTSESPEVI
ncbi:hypothetical protein N7478_009640 [Penicillium angulare]|uniref:uncharacterized protein n=1 Tax=Penicillium angulare TaxID=116970 RepID=UPI0025420F26|nr:uncharacterized protein N7478_009640 [Penicillium angulare]KAJ5266832.1 hypothetical protein N7478_009640 [Penicillium angulare]